MRNVVLMVLVIGLPAVAAAQQPGAGSGQFLAVDIAGGWSAGSRPPGPALDASGNQVLFKGWDVDGTVRFVRPWLGVAGMFSRADADGHVLTQFAAGPRVSSPFFTGGFRGFAHGLVGVARLERPGDTFDTGAVITLGGGLDFLYFGRFQISYVRQDLPGLEKNDLRTMIGAAVPLCLHGCRDYGIDGITILRHRK